MTDFVPQPLNGPGRVGEPNAPALYDVLGASFRSESGLLALYDVHKAREFPANPDFSLNEMFSRRADLLPYADKFQDADSEAEVDSIFAGIKSEQKDRAIRSAAGLTGFVTDTVASVFSPSSFVPLGAVGAGVRGVGRIAGIVGASVALDESILSATQDTRTVGESAANIVGGAIMGAVLGGAVVGLTSMQRAALNRSIDREGTVRMGPHESQHLGGGSIGAQSLRMSLDDPGLPTGVLAPGEEAGLWSKMMDRTLRFNAKASTALRNLVSDVPEARAVQAKLSDVGIAMRSADDGKVTNPGGPIENRTLVLMRSSEVKALHALEQNYANYRYSVPNATGLQRNLAEIKGILPGGGKLSRAQWEEQVFLEMQRPTEGQIPEVVAAVKELRENFYKPLGEEAVKVGLLEEGQLMENYLTHVFRKETITKNPQAFDEMIIRSYQKHMEEAYNKRLEKVTAGKKQAEEDVADIKRPLEEVHAITEDIKAQREALAATPTMTLKRELNDLKAQLRKHLKAGGNPRELNDKIAKKQAQMSAADAEIIKQDNALRRRGQVLARAIARLDERQAAALVKLEAAEEAGLDALRGTVNKSKKFFDEMAGLTDEEYARGVAELENDFHRLAERLEALELKTSKIIKENPDFETGPTLAANGGDQFWWVAREVEEMNRLEQMLEGKPDGEMMRWLGDSRPEPVSKLRERLAKGRADIAEARKLQAEGVDAADIQSRFDPAFRVDEERMNMSERVAKTADLLEDASREGPEFARATLQDWFDDTLRDVQARLARTQQRSEKLIARAKSLDPKYGLDRIKTIETKVLRADEDLDTWLQQRGGKDRDGKLDFTETGAEHARALRQKIIGDPTRVVGVDLAAERGPELARILDIPIEDKMQFLETSMDKLVRIYARNLAPDIEMSRAGFGVNGAKAFEKVEIGFQKKIDEVKANEKLTPAQKEKAFEKIARQREDTLRSFTGQIQRLRHQRGVPPDPDNYLYRGGRMVQQWNVLTMMGNVLSSSLVDPATVVVRYGLRRVFRDGIKAYVHGLKTVRLAQREAKYAGMNELMLQDRFHQISDLLEDVGRRTRGEKAVDFLANKIGIAGLFSYWTQFMKEWTTPIAAGRLLDAVEVHMTGKGHMSVPEARKVLAAMHLDDDLARRIWAQQENGGLVREGDLWIPNTESWNDASAVEAFRAAIVGEVEAAIVTPGLERPLFMDASLVHRLAFQFQSFMWSSHAKVVFPMMQRRDWHAMEAIMATIPLAALSYFVDQTARGNDPTEKDLDVWMDEILTRSPLIGVLAQAQRAAESFPATRPMVTFSDEGAERLNATSGMGLIFGPGYTTARRALKLAAEFQDPTLSTANTVKGLMPFNNVVWARQMFDAAAENSGLPERRE